MLVVVALGGNALLKRSQPLEADLQRCNVRAAGAAVAEIAREHKVVVTHGNGPQVGLLALQSEAYREVEPYPLDILGAESEGMIGYLVEQELENRLPGRRIATLLTQTVVDPKDAAFATPTKFVGPLYGEDEARRLDQKPGFRLGRDGQHFRRVVPSPEPVRILELSTIKLLVQHDVVVVCAGGGGVPVILNAEGAIQGVEAVVDKDLASALLAVDLDADYLLLLTDVPAVYAGWGTPAATPIRRATPSALRSRTFAAGSMGPKVEGACRFVCATGKRAGIGSLEDAVDILRGAAGTTVDLSQ